VACPLFRLEGNEQRIEIEVIEVKGPVFLGSGTGAVATCEGALASTNLYAAPPPPIKTTSNANRNSFFLPPLGGATSSLTSSRMARIAASLSARDIFPEVSVSAKARLDNVPGLVAHPDRRCAGGHWDRAPDPRD